jgi:hypothetical protein
MLGFMKSRRCKTSDKKENILLPLLLLISAELMIHIAYTNIYIP